MIDPNRSIEGVIAYLKKLDPGDGTRTVELPPSDLPLVRPWLPGFAITYVLDEGSSFSYVSRQRLRDAGLDEGAFHALAVRNLARKAWDSVRVQSYGEAFAVFLDGNLEASLLLVDELWEPGLSHTTPNGAVAVAPARDVLAYCDSQSSGGLAELRAIASRMDDCDHPLSGDLLARRGGRWELLK